MRAMVVVFFFSRARVLRVRMSSFVQGWRLTFFAIHLLPSATNLPTHIQYYTFIAYKTLSVDNPSASSKPVRQAIHGPYKHHLDAEVVYQTQEHPHRESIPCNDGSAIWQ